MFRTIKMHMALKRFGFPSVILKTMQVLVPYVVGCSTFAACLTFLLHVYQLKQGKILTLDCIAWICQCVFNSKHVSVRKQLANQSFQWTGSASLIWIIAFEFQTTDLLSDMITAKSHHRCLCLSFQRMVRRSVFSHVWLLRTVLFKASVCTKVWY